MTRAIFNWILSFFIHVVGYFLDLLAQALPVNFFPDLSVVSNAFASFYEVAFSTFNWLRQAFLIDALSISIIIDIFVIKYASKPVISIIKLCINWFKNSDGS